jgi:hypothetical protein
MAGFEFHQQVNIAVGVQPAAQCGTKERQFLDMMFPAEFRQLVFGDIFYLLSLLIQLHSSLSWISFRHWGTDHHHFAPLTTAGFTSLPSEYLKLQGNNSSTVLSCHT